MFGRAKRSTCGAVVVAAGSGTRMRLGADKSGTPINKVFLEVGGMPSLHIRCVRLKAAAASTKSSL